MRRRRAIRRTNPSQDRPRSKGRREEELSLLDRLSVPAHVFGPFRVFDDDDERSVAGFCVGVNEFFIGDADDERRHPDQSFIQQFESRGNFVSLRAVRSDDLPCFFETAVLRQDLVFHIFKTAHSSTSSNFVRRGRVLCVTGATTFSVGYSISSARSYACSPKRTEMRRALGATAEVVAVYVSPASLWIREMISGYETLPSAS